MAEAVPERDASLLLDMLLAARDAREFTRGMDEDDFKASRLHQNAVIRSLEVIREAARLAGDTIDMPRYRMARDCRHARPAHP